MAGEEDKDQKTEEPTQKKLDDALKRGDVAKSQEINTFFILGAGTLALMVFAGNMSGELATTMRGILANLHTLPTDGQGLMRLSGLLSLEILAAVAVPFLVLALAAIAGNMVQHRLVWSAENMKPKASKVSPMAGFKRLFSKQSLMNFVKGLLKLAVVGTVMVVLLWPERHRLEGLVTVEPAALLPLTHGLSLKLLGSVVAILAVIAAADFFFQYRQWRQRQMMSVQEIKDEYKQTEGDPFIKGKLKQLRQARMRNRMMANVPKASVIITNPTHFAVALQYEQGMNAPVCLAKGVDALALRIRAVATEHDVPIVENPPLARALHATVEIDQEIPAEHYKAVAEVIGYVMKLRRGLR
ncbi:MAG TPA: flagellar biosynthesis protein FlhB [Xanthobacteraceae bacterium]|nr:flagellar biosynthesis protein FlhB [Xanthobacteraceae bacterium]